MQIFINANLPLPENLGGTLTVFNGLLAKMQENTAKLTSILAEMKLLLPQFCGTTTAAINLTTKAPTCCELKIIKKYFGFKNFINLFFSIWRATLQRRGINQWHSSWSERR
jgi:hypothetical protein